MLPSTPPYNNFAWRLVLALCVVATALLLLITEIDANGAHPGAREVFSGLAGPYEVRVETAPVVGNMHMTIYLSPTDPANSAIDAGIQISGTGPLGNSQTVGPVIAIGSQTTWYGVDLPIEEAGAWVFTLTVESSQGDATVDFSVKVQEPSGTSWAIFGIGVILLLLVLWFAARALRSSTSADPVA